MIVMTGMHGNEPAGPRAAQRVLDRLERKDMELCGRFVALAGNLKALAEKTRFLDRDLNRQWTPAKLAAAEDQTVNDAEAGELRELLAALRKELKEIAGPVYFLDLHTTSAASPPFVTVGDTLRNRAFAEKFCVPVILGLEECIDGSLLEYVNNLGHVTVGVEGGQLAVILLAFLAVGHFRSRDWYRARISIPASCCIALVGLFWTVERIFLN